MYFYGCNYSHVNTRIGSTDNYVRDTVLQRIPFTQYEIDRGTCNRDPEKLANYCETKQLDDMPSDEAFLMVNEGVDAASV